MKKSFATENLKILLIFSGDLLPFLTLTYFYHHNCKREIYFYMHHKSFCILIAIAFSSISFAQTAISGAIYDAESNSPLPYVNVGIKNKNIGTGSRSNGNFLINIPAQNANDTLTFSIVGYSELNIPIRDIISTHQTYFTLKRNPAILSQVTVTANFLKEKKFGIKNEKALIHFVDGSINQNDIFEIAQLVKFDTIRSKITSVNLLVNHPRKDSATFRINFYRYNDNLPSERIVEKSIIQRKQITKGWLKFDLSDSAIFIKGNFVAAVEFIPAFQKSEPIYYEVKIGGAAKSFVRTSSQGLWRQPPHHYKMYVTALVKSSKKRKHLQVETDEDIETARTKNLFSQSVKDSFSIFVQLPEKYDAKKNGGYKVVYLLDGNAFFDAVADEIKKQKKDIILVGIGYTNAFLMDSLRNRDYTYPVAADNDSLLISGGGKQFLKFLAGELLPYIDKTYQTDTFHRTLMGHSLGGYFTLFAMEQGLLNKSSLFNRYVSASPSLDYANQYLIKESQNIIPNNTNPQTLILTIGENELKEDVKITEFYNSFIKSASEIKYKHIKLTSDVFPAFGHMDTAIPTFLKAINEIK